MATEILCNLLKNSKNSYTKKILEHDTIHVLFNELFTTHQESTQKNIIHTFETLSANKVFVKSWTPEYSQCIYDAFKIYPQFNKQFYTIAINCFDQYDLEQLALPMLSISRMTDNKAFDLFFKLVIMRKYRKIISTHIFEDMNTLLSADNNKHIELALYNICHTNNEFVKDLKINIWKSSCRETLIRSASMQNGSYSQFIVLSVTAAAFDSLIFDKHYLNKNELTFIVNCIFNNDMNTINFGVGMLAWHQRHILINDDIAIRLLKLQSSNKLTDASSANCFNIIFNYLLHKENIDENTASVMKELCKKYYNYTRTSLIESTESIEYLERNIKLCKILNIDVTKFEEKAHKMYKDKKVKSILQKNGVVINTPDEFKCPITHDVMKDPIVASDGFSYEKQAMEEFLRIGNKKSPMTREHLNNILIPNLNLKKRIRDYEEEICDLVCKKPK